MKILYVILFLFSAQAFSQGIEIDDSSYGSQALAELLLNNACVDITNPLRSSSASVGYFNGNSTDFPLEEGVVIRSGNIADCAGIYTGDNLGSTTNVTGDADLDAIANSSGQPANITDVAFLQFEFVPLSENFSFNFLFASNEYGEWQCVSTDAFAFLLTNLETGETTNLAVLPGTTTPISVNNIRDQAYNPSCTSQNPEKFDTYTVDSPMNSSVNMRGYTHVMNASAPITPNTPYRIRLVVGDSNDTDYDSAIFLEAGSFKSTLDLGEDQTLCEGDSLTLETGLPTSAYIHLWKRNDQVIPGENGNSITVTQTGTYKVEVTKADTGCIFSDEVIVSDLMVETPQDLFVCGNNGEAHSYDLTQNDAENLGLDPDQYQVVFYASENDISNDSPIPADQLQDYTSDGEETIYIKILDTLTGDFCDAVYDFDLLLNSTITPVSPEAIEVCYSASGYDIDLTQVNAEILNGQSASGVSFSFYNSEESAQMDQDNIENPLNYNPSPGFGTKTIWVRVQNSGCFALIPFTIIEHPLPPISELPDVTVCQEFIVPSVEHGEVYSESQGEGEHYNAGDAITESGFYYIFNGPDENGCTNETSFRVTVIEKYDVSGTYCGHFTVPEPPAGHFYTAIDGPNGSGEIIPPGTQITSSQSIYFYAEVDGSLCKNEEFVIAIVPLPTVDQVEDVVVCQSYTLPPLTEGNYYTESGGNGTELFAGDVITTSQTLYVFIDDGNCTNESEFQIAIVQNFSDLTVCGSYTLPELDAGNYYPQPGGQGEQIPAGTELTTSQTVYVYAETTEGPNCTVNLSFDITIKPVPAVDSMEDVVFCGEHYTLPDLDNGDYFTESHRNGDQLFPGDEIDSTQQLYINNTNGECDSETTFTVTVAPLPPISNFTDIYSCGPYVLPDPAYGKIYTAPDGGGTLLEEGDVISSTQTLYIYNRSEEPPFCENQQEFTVYITDLDVGSFDDVYACESYVLPPLDLGNYYTQAHGKGQKLFAGDVIDSSQTLYVYVKQGDRFVCENEENFDVIISETPQLPLFDDVERCGSYTLPDLNTDDYNVGYYLEPNGQSEIDPVNYTFTEPGVYTIYVYATALENPDCFDEEKFQLTINPLRELNISDATICVDVNSGEVLQSAYLDSGLDSSLFQIDWFLDGQLVHTGPDYEVSQAGEYTIKTTKKFADDGTLCSFKTAKVRVTKSSSPIAKAYVSEDFSAIANIRVEVVKGVGQYLYQLDDGPPQTDKVFHDVDTGIHQITVESPNGDCGKDVLEVQVIKYPKFFTPNNDGKNDRWNIKDLANHPEAEIFIFDRYGKFLKKIYPSGPGWDGRYNGNDEIVNDYWFKVNYHMAGEDRQFISHFTLKR